MSKFGFVIYDFTLRKLLFGFYCCKDGFPSKLTGEFVKIGFIATKENSFIINNL